MGSVKLVLIMNRYNKIFLKVLKADQASFETPIRRYSIYQKEILQMPMSDLVRKFTHIFCKETNRGWRIGQVIIHDYQSGILTTERLLDWFEIVYQSYLDVYDACDFVIFWLENHNLEKRNLRQDAKLNQIYNMSESKLNDFVLLNNLGTIPELSLVAENWDHVDITMLVEAQIHSVAKMVFHECLDMSRSFGTISMMNDHYSITDLFTVSQNMRKLTFWQQLIDIWQSNKQR